MYTDPYSRMCGYISLCVSIEASTLYSTDVFPPYFYVLNGDLANNRYNGSNTCFSTEENKYTILFFLKFLCVSKHKCSLQFDALEHFLND